MVRSSPAVSYTHLDVYKRQPEHIYGYDHVASCYKEDPRTSWGKIVDHMKQLYPEAADMQIKKILK